MINCFDITDFGALSDGRTDCTKAIQAALDKAGEVEGKVIVPPGGIPLRISASSPQCYG
ncbi:MAG: hypothetical protein II802_01905 [Clostridia bacterium]|nr:hypothetical protein [Clostridia bacterium]